MSLITEPSTRDPLANLPRAHRPTPLTDYRDRPVTPARQIVVDFLTARLAANNARIVWLLEGSPDALTAWVNAENKALGDSDND